MNQSETFLQSFLSHRQVTNELIQFITPENYGFKPSETSMEAAKLARHIMESSYKFASVVKTGSLAPFQEKTAEEPDLHKFAEVYTNKTKEILASLSDQDFEKDVDVSAIFGSSMTGLQLLRSALEHEIHHKGALFVYVRGMGHTELPFFVKR
ncbi:DinB family protein [Peribacillus kribbensis]|uniref:DinB family protein n=1 Tax=Peribacillus kribbensis TaxID=356658 RepID=UPI0004181B65|nr:DinB family protein [Peribacillus kribbensis]